MRRCEFLTASAVSGNFFQSFSKLRSCVFCRGWFVDGVGSGELVLQHRFNLGDVVFHKLLPGAPALECLSSK